MPRRYGPPDPKENLPPPGAEPAPLHRRALQQTVVRKAGTPVEEPRSIQGEAARMSVKGPPGPKDDRPVIAERVRKRVVATGAPARGPRDIPAHVVKGLSGLSLPQQAPGDDQWLRHIQIGGLNQESQDGDWRKEPLK